MCMYLYTKRWRERAGGGERRERERERKREIYIYICYDRICMYTCTVPTTTPTSPGSTGRSTVCHMLCSFFVSRLRLAVLLLGPRADWPRHRRDRRFGKPILVRSRVAPLGAWLDIIYLLYLFIYYSYIYIPPGSAICQTSSRAKSGRAPWCVVIYILIYIYIYKYRYIEVKGCDPKPEIFSCEVGLRPSVRAHI